MVMAVTDENSDIGTKAWLAMIGTWTEVPMPIPAIAWLLTQCKDGEPISSVYINNAPIVAMAEPKRRKGT